MGAIRESSTGKVRLLEPRHVVGRMPAPRCSLTLDQPFVSGVHAEFRWTGLLWELKDLGSRNGTYLDGRRLEPSAPDRIRQGLEGRLRQTRAAVGDDRRVATAGHGRPPGRRRARLAPRRFHRLPSTDDPRATIYRTVEGGWVLESPDEMPRPLTDLQTFEAVGRLWRFSCADMPPATLASQVDARPLRLEDIELAF